MKKFLILSLSLSFFLFAKEQQTYGDIKVSKLISIYDGDTFKVDINELPPIIGQNIPIKIANVDAPDLYSKDPEIKKKAYQAKMFTKEFLQNGSEIILKNIKRDKYFRLSADVIVDGKNLGLELINNKLALPYVKNKKPKWLIIN
jgi:micrococcal nuclease